MSEPLPFADNSITSFLYQPFSYTIPNPNVDVYTLSITRTSGLPASYLSNFGSEVVFETPSNLMLPGTQSFTITATGGGSTLTSTNTVSTSVGRFVDSNGNGFVGSNYTFFAKEAITPIKMTAPFPIVQPTSTPTLPPGLFFTAVDGSNVFIAGTPSVTSPQSNYLIIGKAVGSSRTVSSTIGIIVSNERLQTAVTPNSLISGMFIGEAITPRVITARGNGVIRYTFPTFPDGIVVTDLSGVVQPVSSFGFTPTDPSYTMIIRGTPTLTAATAFKNAGFSNGVTQSILVERTSPLPLIASSIPITFAFGETVLFDAVTVPPLYTNVALNPTATFFRAATYFAGVVPIISIVSPNLRPDLTLTFNGTDRAFLSGTPTSAGSETYTIRATNFSGRTRDLLVPITVTTDSVVFSPRVDTSYTFVLSRPLDLSLNGYYPTPITFAATAQSGGLLSWSAPGLAGTGLTLSTTTGPSVSIVGTPTTVTPSQTLTVTATAAVTLATASQTVTISVIDDVFTFANPGTLQFNQNRTITPVQFVATTLSGRQVNSYSAAGLPLGLSLSTTGRLTGTPVTGVTGTFTVTASTGFTSKSQPFAYTFVSDSMLLFTPQSDYFFVGGDSVSVQVTASSFGGATVSNYALTLDPALGVTINSVTGLISGTWTDGNPPNTLLPQTATFQVTAQAGGVTGELDGVVGTTNAVLNESLVIFTRRVTGESVNDSLIFRSSNYTNWSPIGDTFTASTTYVDIEFASSNVGSTILISEVGGSVLRATTFSDFTSVLFEPIPTFRSPRLSSLANKTGTTTWWGIGSLGTGATTRDSVLYKSTNDGVSWGDLSSLSRIVVSGQLFVCRDLNLEAPVSTSSPSPYLKGGAALKYQNGVLMIGGGLYPDSYTMARSTDEGVNWESVTGNFGQETANFSLEASGMWIATGSDANSSYSPDGYETTPTFAAATTTIRYSTNDGRNWTAATGGFNMFGYEVVYGGGTWVATGVSGRLEVAEPPDGPSRPIYNIELRYSTDGMSWNNITSFSTFFGDIDQVVSPVAPLPLGSLTFDGTTWRVFAYKNDITRMFQHDSVSSLATGWTSSETTGFDATTSTSLSPRFLSVTRPKFIRQTTGVATIQLAFFIGTGTGPTIASPTQRSFLVYQYVPIAPIQLTAVGGSGIVYFFVNSSELPDGLTFNPITNTITGTPARTGTSSLIIYAKDNNGVTIFTLSIQVILASMTRQQDGAGAYTSLVRQYTEVNAAITARDSKATPSNEYRLGEFTSPVPPSVITDSNCPKC